MLRISKKVIIVCNSLLLLLSMLAAGAHAQDRRMSGPLLGFIRDSEELSIKPLYGVPGAATIGPALELPLHFFQIDFSLKNDFAIAVTEWTSELILLKNLSRKPTFETIFAADGRIERIALSSNANYAAIMSDSVIRVLRGLPSRTTVLREINASVPGLTLTALAVNDTGEVAAAFSDGSQGFAYWNGAGAELQPIAVAGEISALAFVQGRRGIVMTDRLLNEVSFVSDPSSNPSSVRLADAADDVSDPAAVQISSSGSQAIVAGGASGTILIINFAGGTPAKISCGCRATTLRALRGDTVFALTEPSASPVMLFDGAGDARVVVASSDQVN